MTGNLRRFKIAERFERGATVLAVTGDLDAANAPALRSHLDGDGSTARPVVIDLSDCDFIDSAGIALIVEACRNRIRADRKNGARGCVSLALAAPSGQVDRIIRITGLQDGMSVCGEIEHALAAVTPQEISAQDKPTPA